MAKRKWLLLVDDDPVILEILEVALAHPELSITTATDALQAFIQARDIQPLLIISDIQMPGFGYGTDTFKKLREDSRIPCMPVIFMTGMDLEKARQLLPPNDPTIGLISKPLDLDRLRDYVWKLTGIIPSAPEVRSPLQDFLSRKVHKLLIDGKLVDAASGKLFTATQPASGELIGLVAEAASADVDLAVAAARRALEGPWSKMSPADREGIILKAAELLEARAVIFAQLEAHNSGNPLDAIKNGDLPSAIAHLRYFAAWSAKIPNAVTLGSVVGILTPRDFPLLTAVERLARALARGNTVILKPAERTPLSALWLGELLMEAGVPAGVVNVIPGPGPTVGVALAMHTGIDKVDFTGSPDVACQIENASAGRTLRVSMEFSRAGAATAPKATPL